MPGKDDLVDEFDDDNLRRSIEAAEGRGPWRPDATFDDPKLQALAEQLARAPRRSYTERRLAELDRRAAKKAAPVAPTPASPFVESAPVPEAPIAAGPGVAGVLGARPAHVDPTARLRAALAEHVPTMVAAWLVFALATIVQGIVSGYTTALYVRSAVVASLVGIAWCCVGAGRFRSAAIGAGAYLVAFLASTEPGSPTDTFGVFLAMLLVLLGSSAVGLSREGIAADRV